MEERAKRGDLAACLDLIKGSTAIKAHINCKQFFRAADLLNKMIDECTFSTLQNKKSMPDFKTFQTVISGLCSSNLHLDADTLLRRLWKFSGAVRGYRTTTALLNLVLASLVNDGYHIQADALLQHMENMYDERVIKEYPIHGSYQIMISAYANSSNDSNKLGRIRALQWRMDQPRERVVQTSTRHANSSRRPRRNKQN
jgi:hypothetical protein